MTKKSDSREFMLKMAHDGALAWIDQLIKYQEDGVRDLKEYRQRFVDAVATPDRSATPINVLSWTVNQVNNIHRQGRLDLVVHHASAIAMATAYVSQEKK